MKRKIDLRLIDWEFKPQWAGTFKMFGLRSLLSTMSPLFNTIFNWKYRDMSLDIPMDASVSPEEEDDKENLSKSLPGT